MTLSQVLYVREELEEYIQPGLSECRSNAMKKLFSIFQR